MRNKYNQHQQLQQEYEQQHHHQRSKFLPMLCSSSTKQVIKLSHRRNASTSSSSSSTVSDEPLSPRVGCMGQVKRNNKVVGFPNMSFVSGFSTSNTSSPNNNMKSDQMSSNYSSSNSIVKYHNLIRFFSTKSLTSSPKTAIAAAAVPRKGKIIAGRSTINSNNSSNNSIRSRGTRLNTRSVRDDHGIIISRSKNEGNCGNNNESNKGCLVNLVELDPPLPVVKQKQQQEKNNSQNASLWKRRSGGAPLKGLQLQVSQQSCTLLLQSTTV
ncbi:probable serine/threonine-protein kinase dyrk1 [Chenopodium quinoa]|uniref:probable serine/threonine-protein kinase dyrk1 n=1 Tax=Chenopodium quinoa TaxID=63459 RepID=UPI000B76E4FA|nr:probable serine/threonine-protein kinase dyrk1 [Chenopodium quinoa]